MGARLQRLVHPARIVLALALLASCSTMRRPQQPSLVVMISVDQLRADLLDRYDAAFTGGLRTLRDRGVVFPNTYVDHAPTTSFPGHTTLASGCDPAHHGIVAGGWPERIGDGKFRGVEPARDESEKIVGFPALPGASPRNILVPELADWINAHDRDSRVVALGGGEFSSLLHGGHTHQTTYWFTADAGQFVTSTFYAPSDPEWISRFNRDELPAFRDGDLWTCSVPDRYRVLALPDAQPFEFDGVHTSFPHRFAGESTAHADWMTWTPAMDAATFALARRAVTELSLGRRGHVDYLDIVASSVDSVGHRFGPFSLETLDTLVRLDRELGELFALLDRTVGRDRWVVALSADHGVDDVPEHLQAEGIAAHRTTPEELDAAMNAAFAITHDRATPEQTAAVKQALSRFPFIDRVLSGDDLAAAPATDTVAQLFRHSYRADRVPVTLAGSHGSLARLGLIAVLKPHVIPEAPANHGSPYDYDRHVPLIIYGAGLQPRVDPAMAHTKDVAPTLAAIAGIPVPNPIDGHALIATP